MVLLPDRISLREKLILAGLFLAKYDIAGLKALGFESFLEAFNVIGYGLGAKPASIKNYRDEFDPLFPNSRKGWHKRPTRDYCLKVFEVYKDLDFSVFTGLIKSFGGFDENALSQNVDDGCTADGESQFAKRLITGLAAERYFECVHTRIQEFKDLKLQNTSRLGCGYDFQLQHEGQETFLAVEVKGLKDRSGSISMTPKEHAVAEMLRDRFYLFVVKNFRENPFHEVYQDPLSSSLLFTKQERAVVQVSWLTTV